MARPFASVWDGLRAFAQWWGEELRGLVPRGLRQLFQRSETRIVIAAERSGLELYEERGSQLKQLDRKARGEPAAKVLAQLKARKWRGPIGVRVPLDSCFIRVVDLPASARGDFGSILSLDLERATPFRAGEVYTAYYVEDERPVAGKLKVRQLVVKREAIVPLVADAEAIGLDVSFADSWNESRSGGLPINFLAPEGAAAAASARPGAARRVLAAAAVLLLISAGYLLFQRYDSALAELEAATAEAKVKAQSMRQAQERSQAAANELAALRRIKVDQPSSVEIVEEVTRLVPDAAWVSHLRIDKDTVELTGVAQSGAALLPLLERSPLFVDAKLTAPLRFDEQENGERFSIKMRLRRAPGAAGAASTEDKG